MTVSSEQPCQKVVLAEGLNMRVIHCLRHQTVELEIGPILIRLNESSLRELSELITEAVMHLTVQNTAHGSAYEALIRKLRNQ